MALYLGPQQVGECQRCGQKFQRVELTEDGYVRNLLVCKACYEEDHPQRYAPVERPEGIAPLRPAPMNLPKPTSPVLSIVTTSFTEAFLSWTRSVSTASRIFSYQVFKSVDGGSYELFVELENEYAEYGELLQDFLDITDDELDLRNDHSYSYYVVATQLEGPPSDPSNIVTIDHFSAVSISVFTTSGTWVKPPNTMFVEVFLLAAGGGGGSGRASGTAGQGGRGGGGGGLSTFGFLPDALPATVAVTVDPGGASGPAAIASGGSTANGLAGGDGGITSFGAFLGSLGGSGGPGGQGSGGQTTPAGPGLDSAGGIGGAGNAPQAPQTSPPASPYGGTGGGGGGGSDTITIAPGLDASNSMTYASDGLPAGVGGGANVIGTNGSQLTTGMPGTGGGGGGYNVAGGNGAVSGGGGGGGGHTGNGASGAGGAGGSGQVVVVVYF